MAASVIALALAGSSGHRAIEFHVRTELDAASRDGGSSIGSTGEGARHGSVTGSTPGRPAVTVSVPGFTEMRFRTSAGDNGAPRWPTTYTETSGSSRSATCRSARKAVAFYRQRVRDWRARMALGQEAASRRKAAGLSCPQLRLAALAWRSKAHAWRARYEAWFERTYEKWRCIHEHEGRWNDTGAPYWGGLQMTLWFQQHYGPEFYRRWGTADHWPVYAQLIAAERAWRESGFRQWGTRWMCGL